MSDKLANMRKAENSINGICMHTPNSDTVVLEKFPDQSLRPSTASTSRELSCSFCYFSRIRQEEILQWRCEGHRSIGSSNTDDRSSEVIERLFSDDRRDFARHAAGARVLVEQHHFVTLANACKHAFASIWQEAAKIYHL